MNETMFIRVFYTDCRRRIIVFCAAADCSYSTGQKQRAFQPSSKTAGAETALDTRQRHPVHTDRVGDIRQQAQRMLLVLPLPLPLLLLLRGRRVLGTRAQHLVRNSLHQLLVGGVGVLQIALAPALEIALAVGPSRGHCPDGGRPRWCVAVPVRSWPRRGRGPARGRWCLVVVAGSWHRQRLDWRRRQHRAQRVPLPHQVPVPEFWVLHPVAQPVDAVHALRFLGSAVCRIIDSGNHIPDVKRLDSEHNIKLARHQQLGRQLEWWRSTPTRARATRR